MSTKTTFKRVALVAVASMGFGILTSVSPANAADTASFTVNTDSVTVVTNGTAANEVTRGAIFKVTLRNVGATATAQTLQSGETLTVSVVEVPRGTANTAKSLASNAADLKITKLIPTVDNGTVYTPSKAFTAGTDANGTHSYGSADTAYKNNAGNGASTLANSFFFGVTPTAADVIGEGTYTLRLRLTSGNGSLLVQDKLVKVTFVNGAVNSGAILTASTAGVFPVGVAHSTYALTKHIKATVTDANGGVLIGEDTAGTHNTPDLTVDMIDKDGALVAGTDLTEVDDASTADHGYTTTTTDFAGVTEANIASSRNGTYGITGGTASFAAASTTNKIRVRYGASSATAAITIINAPGGTAGTPVITATGLSATSAAPTWTVGLKTTTVNYLVTGGLSGQTYTYTVTWSGTFAAGDVSPVSATPKTVVADAAGVISFAITNAAPLDGAIAKIVVTGFATNASAAEQTINWKKAAAATASVDMDGAYVALKSATKFTATFLDNFGAPVAGLVVRPSVAGINKDAATAPRATLVTDAAGQVSITLTDALAAAADTDTVTFASLSPVVSASSTITYAATAPVATALTGTYNANPTTAAASVVTLIPATGIYVTGTTKFPVQIARNNASAVTPTNEQDHLIFRVSAGVAGVAVTATASTGAYVLGSSNTQKSSVLKYTDADGFADVRCWIKCWLLQTPSHLHQELLQHQVLSGQLQQQLTLAL
jgi:trimeric autotransporter adhesin